jgi:hypothetical protein
VCPTVRPRPRAGFCRGKDALANLLHVRYNTSVLLCAFNPVVMGSSPIRVTNFSPRQRRPTGAMATRRPRRIRDFGPPTGHRFFGGYSSVIWHTLETSSSSPFPKHVGDAEGEVTENAYDRTSRSMKVCGRERQNPVNGFLRRRISRGIFCHELSQFPHVVASLPVYGKTSNRTDWPTVRRRGKTPHQPAPLCEVVSTLQSRSVEGSEASHCPHTRTPRGAGQALGMQLRTTL